MKVIEHLEKKNRSHFSYEIVPPMRGSGIQTIIEMIDSLLPYHPLFIDVTSHSSSESFEQKEDGSIKRKVFKKRPGTIGICGVIQNRFRIDTVAHILCQGYTKEETEDALIELSYMGIHNIMALRGDTINYKKKIATGRSVNDYAIDLVKQVVDLKHGRYASEDHEVEALDFGVGVAGYPEKHFEAPNMKTDINFLKEKIAAGAEYVTTQMFFDNKHYFNFVKMCRDAGITVPIVPGIKVLKSSKQILSIPKNFYVDIPEALTEELHSNSTHAFEIGATWATKQVKELLEKGAPCVHFYLMNDDKSVLSVMKNLKNF